MSSRITILDNTFRKTVQMLSVVREAMPGRVYHAFLQDMINPVLPCFTFTRLPVTRETRYTRVVYSMYECFIWFLRGRETADNVYQAIIDEFDNEWIPMTFDGVPYGKARFVVETSPDSGTDLQTGNRYLSFRVRAEGLFVPCNP